MNERYLPSKKQTTKRVKSSEFANGLNQIMLHDNNVDGYGITTYKCLKCGTENSNPKSNLCPTCHISMLVHHRMSSDIVKEIRSRRTGYQCPICKTVYSIPLDCCLSKEHMHRGELVEYGM